MNFIPTLSELRGRFLARLLRGLLIIAKTFCDPAGERKSKRIKSASGLPSITYVMNRDRVNLLFDRIVQSARPHTEIFSREGTLVSIQPDRGVQTLTPQTLNGVLSSMMEIRYERQEPAGIQFKRYGLLRQDQAAAFVLSNRIVSQFPLLKHYTRSPQFDAAWRLIAKPGYNRRTGVYYAGPAITPARGTQLLDRVLAEFCWKRPADRVNFIGMLVTGITMSRWPGKHPLLIFSANQSGLGKTLLAKLLSLILHGSFRTLSYTPNDEEFEKQLATLVDAGDQVVTIDNAKRQAKFHDDSIVIESAVLERCITDGILNFRRLGSNTSIRRPNDVQVCITLNNPLLGADLRRRQISICLEYQGSPEERVFLIPDLDDFVVAHRAEILAEILGLVDRWVRAGCPMPDQPARHSISQSWAATIDGILRFNGWSGFLQKDIDDDDSPVQADLDYPIMDQVCEAFHDAQPGPATAWVPRLHELGVLRSKLVPRSGAIKSERAQATIVGLFLHGYTNRVFEVAHGRFRLVSTQDEKAQSKAHTSVEYWFEQIGDAQTQSISDPPGALREAIGALERQEPGL